MKVKGGVYCQSCDRPVAAQKSTHRLRNVAAVVTAPTTLGVSLLGTAAGKWHCPLCGGPVVPVKAATPAARTPPVKLSARATAKDQRRQESEAVEHRARAGAFQAERDANIERLRRQREEQQRDD